MSVMTMSLHGHDKRAIKSWEVAHEELGVPVVYLTSLTDLRKVY